MALIMNDIVVGALAGKTNTSHPFYDEVQRISVASDKFATKMRKKLESTATLSYEERRALQSLEDCVRAILEAGDSQNV